MSLFLSLRFEQWDGSEHSSDPKSKSFESKVERVREWDDRSGRRADRRNVRRNDVRDKGKTMRLSPSRIWFTALYHFTCSTWENLWRVLMYSCIYYTLFMAFLSSHTLFEVRASTHSHNVGRSNTLLRRCCCRHTLAPSRSLPALFARCRRRRGSVWPRAFVCVCALRVFIHSMEKKTKSVIAYRPAKASSANNNRTATEWTAHTISVFPLWIFERERARDHKHTQYSRPYRIFIYSTKAYIGHTAGRTGSDVFAVRAHTSTSADTNTIAPSNRQCVFLCKYFSDFDPSII